MDLVDDSLTFIASYNRTEYSTQLPLQPAASTDFKLKGYSFSPSYTQNILLNETERGGVILQSLTYGVTYDKSWTQDFGIATDDETAIVRLPISIGYNFTLSDPDFGLFAAGLSYVRNLPFGPAGEGEDYRADRVNSNPRYDKFVANIAHKLEFDSGWSYSATIFGQRANEPMIQAEAFALGGESSIRGLEDSATVGESGVSGQLELVTPDVIPSNLFSTKLLAFVDGGWVQKINPGAAESLTESVVATGAGLRFAGPRGTFANIAAGWLVGGSAVERKRPTDGRIQIYLSAGVNF